MLARTDCYVKKVNIIDFFAGPGRDETGQSGSPLIALEEMKKFCANRSAQKVGNREIRFHFNDKEQAAIDALKCNIEAIRCPKRCCSVSCSTEDFEQSFPKYLPSLTESGTANLVILDQFGWKHVDRDVFAKLMACNSTDVIMFVASSNVKRFFSQDFVAKQFPDAAMAFRTTNHRFSHLVIRDQFRHWVPEGKRYFVPAFSIRSSTSGNVNGLLLGTPHPKGLNIFLKACWEADPYVGRANFNITQEPQREGQLTLFGENKSEAWLALEADLDSYLRREGVSNVDLYEFLLERDFYPPIVKERLLVGWRNRDKLRIVNARDGSVTKHFYLTWQNYSSGSRRAIFRLTTR